MRSLALAVKASLTAALVVVFSAQMFPASHAALPLPPPPEGGSLAAESADTQPPVTVAKGADEAWHAKAVTIRFEASDDLSGVAATYYALDGGAWTQGTSLVVGRPQRPLQRRRALASVRIRGQCRQS